MDCSKALVMNESYRTSDLVSSYLKMSYFDRDSYDGSNKAFSEEIFGLGTLDYDSFSQKREKLRQLLVDSGINVSSQTTISRTLSPEAAAAYSQCISQESKGLINAWVDKTAGNSVSVMVKTGFGGKSNVEVIISGDVMPKEGAFHLLQGNSQLALTFNLPSKKDSLVTISATEKTIDFSNAVSLILECFKRHELKHEMQLLTTTIEVGAGCHGSSSGCQIARMGSIIAPPNFYLLPETLRFRERNLIGGPGVRDWSISKKVTSKNNEALRIDIFPHSVDGNDGDAQGIELITYECYARRDHL
jgi:hypothetical protein